MKDPRFLKGVMEIARAFGKDNPDVLWSVTGWVDGNTLHIKITPVEDK